MFKLRYFTLSWKIFAHFEFDDSNKYQKLEQGDKRTEK